MLTPLGWAGEVTRQTRIKERFERVAMESNLMVGIDRIDGQPSELEMDGLVQFLDHVLANAIWKRLDRVGKSFAMDVTAVGPEHLDLKTKKKKRDESHARWAIARTKDGLRGALGSDRVCAVERCWSSVGAIPTRQLGRSSR
jgi:hypothetical protein